MSIKEHYPKDFQEFLLQFKTEDDCRDYLFEIRWPNGFSCPNCKSNKFWITEKSWFIVFPMGIRNPLRQALSSMGHENRYYFGFTIYGGL